MIRLIPVSERHAQYLWGWSADPDMEEFFRRFPPTFTWGSAEMIPRVFQGSYMICDDETPVGLVNLFNADAQHKKIEFGVMVDKKRFAKRSIAAVEALKQALDYVFEYSGFEKAYCLILDHRKDLIALLGKWGFKCDGRLRSNVLWRGKFHDELCFSLLKDEYRRVK